MLWFLAKVYPILKDLGDKTLPRVTLQIAGNTEGKSCDWLNKRIKNNDSIALSTDVADMEPFYAKASVFINPIHHGTGVKMKCLQAVQNGLPVVTTTMGARGSGLENACGIILADLPAEFEAAIRQCLQEIAESREIARFGQVFLHHHYAARRIIREI